MNTKPDYTNEWKESDDWKFGGVIALGFVCVLILFIGCALLDGVAV